MSNYCIVKECGNHVCEEDFVNGDLCAPCHEFITKGFRNKSQAYKNAMRAGAMVLASENGYLAVSNHLKEVL